MDEERASREGGNGQPGGGGPPALGDVARDVMDHATIIVRDRIRIGQMEARRYAEHVRRDVAPRAALVAAALGLLLVAALCGLVALFIGIAVAIGSVAWTLVIYCAIFALAALVTAALASREAQRSR
jgi:hypothetical protein